MKRLLTSSGSLLLASCQWLNAGESVPPDKSRYTLINPTPRSLMREMSTDRPDKTESPYTVDAGHFQFEMDVVSYARDRGDQHTDAWAIAPVNLKLGLLNDVDLQVVLEPWNQVSVHDPATGIEEERSGFGDVTTRIKVNLWGNDGGKTAFAMMPFAVFPAAQDGLGSGGLEGGVIFPLAIDLLAGWGLGLMTEFDFLRNDTGGSYHTAFVNTITVSHGIAGNLSGYVEFFSEVSTEDSSRWVGTVDAGFTYQLTENIQLDAGVNIGVTDPADDINPFLGFAWRF